MERRTVMIVYEDDDVERPWRVYSRTDRPSGIETEERGRFATVGEAGGVAREILVDAEMNRQALAAGPPLTELVETARRRSGKVIDITPRLREITHQGDGRGGRIGDHEVVE